jgi:predicted nucleotidyltransferase
MAIKLTSLIDRKEKLYNELYKIVDALKQSDVKKIILFGSLVRQDIRSTSDIDLVVIKETNQRFLDRTEAFYDKYLPSVAVDILCYTPEEFEDMSKWNSFIKKVLKEGEVLYEA